LAEQLSARPPGNGLSNTTSYISSASFSVRRIPEQRSELYKSPNGGEIEEGKKHIRKHNTEVDYSKIARKSVDCIQLIQDSVEWWALVNTAICFVSIKADNFLAS
jgi:hypothetical protein